MNNDWQDSWGTNHGTATGAIFSTSAKLGSHAGSFDGVDDRVNNGSAASLQITGNISFGGWIKRNVAGVQHAIGGRWHWLSNDWRCYYLQIYSDNKAMFFLSANGVTDQFVTSVVTIGTEWTHVIGTYDGANMKIYVNGVYEAATARTGAIFNNSSVLFQLGVQNTNGSTYYSFFNGKKDEIALWSRALTDGGVSVGQTAGGEIAQLWNGGAGLEYPWGVTIPVFMNQYRQRSA